MKFTDQVANAITKLKPRLKDLAEGYVELVAVDEEQGVVRVKLIDGMVC